MGNTLLSTNKDSIMPLMMPPSTTWKNGKYQHARMDRTRRTKWKIIFSCNNFPWKIPKGHYFPSCCVFAIIFGRVKIHGISLICIPLQIWFPWEASIMSYHTLLSTNTSKHQKTEKWLIALFSLENAQLFKISFLVVFACTFSHRIIVVRGTRRTKVPRSPRPRCKCAPYWSKAHRIQKLEISNDTNHYIFKYHLEQKKKITKFLIGVYMLLLLIIS